MKIHVLKKITESASNYDHLEEMSMREILVGMNKEDQSVPLAVEKIIPAIEAFVDEALECMVNGGRLFFHLRVD